MRLLTFSTLFPDSTRPNFGVFVENRLRHLVATGAASSTVLAPVPWFPRLPAPLAARAGAWSHFAAVPGFEHRHGLDVHHPRYLVLPRIGMNLAPFLLYHTARRALSRLIAQGLHFDAIDAHYLYPDGVAAVWLGRRFGKPVVITARGSDATELPDHAIPRALITRALAGADALITVSAGLKHALLRLGAPEAKVTVLRNGVETDVFRETNRAATRARLGLSGPTLISVGGLIPRKRHHLTIAAMHALPGFTLLIAGEGPERAALQALADDPALAGRVRLLGPVPHRDLPAYYSAADASVLASAREGWANVLLESMACGTPAIASNIPGNPEVIRAPAAGLVIGENTAAGIAAGIRTLFADLPSRAATRAYAEPFSWDETSAGQLAIFRKVIQDKR